MVHDNLPSYAKGDPEGTLVVDLEKFLEEAGLRHANVDREDLALIVIRSLTAMYPRTKEILLAPPTAPGALDQVR